VTDITDPGGYFGTSQGKRAAEQQPGRQGHSLQRRRASAASFDTAWGWGTAFVDLNGDGAQDLYAVQGMREFVGNGSVHLFNAKSSCSLTTARAQLRPHAGHGCDVPGDQRALVVFDYNRDAHPTC